MAEDARLSTGFAAHPKTRKLRRRLGTEGCWSLVALILWTANERFDGDLAGLSDEDIEICAEWDGETGGLVRVLTELKFLDGEEGSRSIHDWEDHQPFVAGRPARVAQARKAAHVRWSHEQKTATRQDADSMPDASDEHADSMPTACTQQESAMPPPSLPPSKKKPSSSAAPTTPDDESENPKTPGLAKITDDAISAFNDKLGKPNGVLPSVNPKVGRTNRQQQVRRCVRTASEICEQQFGDPTITPGFWTAYFAEADKDPFKSGRQAPGAGHENWSPTFEYLTRAKVMLEIFDHATSEAAA